MHRNWLAITFNIPPSGWYTEVITFIIITMSSFRQLANGHWITPHFLPSLNGFWPKLHSILIPPCLLYPVNHTNLILLLYFNVALFFYPKSCFCMRFIRKNMSSFVNLFCFRILNTVMGHGNNTNISHKLVSFGLFAFNFGLIIVDRILLSNKFCCLKEIPNLSFLTYN